MKNFKNNRIVSPSIGPPGEGQDGHLIQESGVVTPHGSVPQSLKDPQKRQPAPKPTSSGDL